MCKLLICFVIAVNHSFSSAETHPGRCKWADPIEIVDGHFMPGGTGVLVSDVGGQVSHYSTGPRDLVARPPYDQFFLNDYDLTVEDENGQVLDAETQQPAEEQGER